MKSHSEAPTRVADVYGDKDKDGGYWLKYYKGTEETDRDGNVVALGVAKPSTSAITWRCLG